MFKETIILGLIKQLSKMLEVIKEQNGYCNGTDYVDKISSQRVKTHIRLLLRSSLIRVCTICSSSRDNSRTGTVHNGHNVSVLRVIF